ncbi:hypothetical protein B0H14DRAFT_3462052 [Mycena olivaceomarginata]|nr:hypothetical protein B0H14DRAFT_3474606 [Mycena olivaceomarginata]KAJ7834464.1 hypothetical protein B0H14DRAFT_3462052 [Mycena olivaceomarginata]
MQTAITATENTINEWLTGIRTDVPFTANEYRSVHQTHLKSLQDYETHTARYGLLGKILTRMHNIGRYIFLISFSMLVRITAAPTSVFSKEGLDAALKEWEDGPHSTSTALCSFSRKVRLRY